MIDVLVDVLIDSLKAFGFILIIYFLLSFIEDKIAKTLSKNHHMSPLFGSLFGVIPQCGVSVVASDLYIKKHISIGTLVAVFLACSDEAIPLLLASGGKKTLMVIPLVVSKIIIGFVVGYLLDLFLSKKEMKKHLKNCDNHDIDIHVGCCNHDIEHSDNNFKKEHIIHPLVHSLKLLVYIMMINLVFSFMIYFIGEENIYNFIDNSKYLSPLFAVLVGLIPNCASSVILIELYVNNALLFGATLAGLLVNAGLGIVVLFKDKKAFKNNLFILSLMVVVSLFIGYLLVLFNL